MKKKGYFCEKVDRLGGDQGANFLIIGIVEFLILMVILFVYSYNHNIVKAQKELEFYDCFEYTNEDSNNVIKTTIPDYQKEIAKKISFDENGVHISEIPDFIYYELLHENGMTTFNYHFYISEYLLEVDTTVFYENGVLKEDMVSNINSEEEYVKELKSLIRSSSVKYAFKYVFLIIAMEVILVLIFYLISYLKNK